MGRKESNQTNKQTNMSLLSIFILMGELNIALFMFFIAKSSSKSSSSKKSSKGTVLLWVQDCAFTQDFCTDFPKIGSTVAQW